MKKEQGFTLVELLAVIVVLSIILLIVVPKIGNVIDNAKEGAFKSSSYGIVEAANYYCNTKKLTEPVYDGSEFTLIEGTLKSGEEVLPLTDIALSGSSFVNIDENCNVQMSVTDGVYYATKEYDEVGVLVSLSDEVALTRDEMTQAIEDLQADIVSLNSKLSDPTNPDNVFLNVYPVGSIYMSKESTNPSTLFGGTWIEWGSGRVPVGVNSSDTSFDMVEETGGEKNHVLTIEETPSHSHAFTTDTKSLTGWIANYAVQSSTVGVAVSGIFSLKYVDGWGLSYATMSASASSTYTDGVSIDASHNHSGTTNSSGSGSAHNNLQPYITVYMWKRTA